MTNWEQCPAVEKHPDKLSGMWVFLGTRVPVSALFENLEDGATVEQFLQWFPAVNERNVEAVLAHERESSLGAPAGSWKSCSIRVLPFPCSVIRVVLHINRFTTSFHRCSCTYNNAKTTRDITIADDEKNLRKGQ